MGLLFVALNSGLFKHFIVSEQSSYKWAKLNNLWKLPSKEKGQPMKWITCMECEDDSLNHVYMGSKASSSKRERTRAHRDWLLWGQKPRKLMKSKEIVALLAMKELGRARKCSDDMVKKWWHYLNAIAIITCKSTENSLSFLTDFDSRAILIQV
jgi:hypothetical protein